MSVSSLSKWLLVLFLLVGLLGVPVGAFEPLEEERGEYFDWSPETGYYTGLWFDRNEDFINVEGLFSSTVAPFTAIIGSWFFIIIWGTLVMGLYLHTQDTTLPFVVGILLGSVVSVSAGADGITIMYLTMAFAGGGILTKVLLGRQ